MQKAGLANTTTVGAPLATILFPPEEAGFLVIALLLYHFFQLVVAAPIASRLGSSPHRPGSAGYGAPTTRS